MPSKKFKHEIYWKQRFENLNESLLDLGAEYLDDLTREYDIALTNLRRGIISFYERFADENEISLAESRQILNAGELEEFKWTVQEYIRKGQENAVDQKWLKQLENASTRIRLRRLEALDIQIRQEMEIIAAKRASGLSGLADEVIKEGYYKSIYEIQRGFGISDGFNVLDTKAVDRIAAKPWAPDGKSFSDRIWEDKERLTAELKKELTQSFVRGDSPDQAIKNITRKMQVAKSNAGRLVMTESAYFASISRQRGFEQLGVERYIIVATLDLRTSEICQEMDSQIFDMEDYEPGVTANPFHPWCRTTTAPFMEGFTPQRYMRDPETGKGEEVDSMTYEEWYKDYVVARYGEERAELMRKMLKNKAYDLGLYQRYSKRLRADLPVQNFKEFQELKYYKPDEWEVLKKLYRES